jgi:hypothetical protein
MTIPFRWRETRRAIPLFATVWGIGCQSSPPSPLDRADALLRTELQVLDRFARVERRGPHAVDIKIQDKKAAQISRADFAAIAMIAANLAYKLQPAPTDTVSVVLVRLRRLGPFIWDGSKRTCTFTSRASRPLCAEIGTQDAVKAFRTAVLR